MRGNVPVRSPIVLALHIANRSRMRKTGGHQLPEEQQDCEADSWALACHAGILDSRPGVGKAVQLRRPGMELWQNPPMQMLRPVLLAVGLTVAACDRSPPPPDARLGPVTVVATPAAPGGRYPHLATDTKGGAVLSWLQPIADGGFALQHARWQGEVWSPPATIVTGRDWFINWADFPSVVPVTERLWAAHWLQQRPGSVYSYDVRMAVSTDAGA
jgi:hypothetical protein